MAGEDEPELMQHHSGIPVKNQGTVAVAAMVDAGVLVAMVDLEATRVILCICPLSVLLWRAIAYG
ncbi:MAG: hypothetical protein ACFB21_07805, partial [Opitutales bacterium]